MQQPDLKNNYYLKEELVAFCRKHNLQTTGSKEELTKRITTYLETGEKTTKKHRSYKSNTKIITPNLAIEKNFVCSEKHRTFFKKHIGKNFHFNVTFQKWLKANAGKTYQDAINIYSETTKKKPAISKQFEYNTYIHDFFQNNKDKSLSDAIKCWNYKKKKPGSHAYEKQDLDILKHLS